MICNVDLTLMPDDDESASTNMWSKKFDDELKYNYPDKFRTSCEKRQCSSDSY